MAEVTHEDMLGDRMRERNIGGDYHQHHFADMYIGLALFRRGDLALAASQWLESMRNAIVVGHYRGAAGAIEGSAYISGQMGQSERCCRLLSAAAEIRTRSQMPLYSFRYLHNEEANAAARSSLGQQRYQEAFAEGARMRQEDVVNEALGLLREFSTSGP